MPLCEARFPVTLSPLFCLLAWTRKNVLSQKEGGKRYKPPSPTLSGIHETTTSEGHSSGSSSGTLV